MARRKKNNWFGIVIVVAVVILYNLFSGDGKQQQTAPPGAGSQPPSVAARPDLYGLNGVRSDWPKMAEAGAANEQALLAKNYYVILDDSGSMQSEACAVGHRSRLGAAIDALAAFAEGMPPGANLGVMSFAGGRFSELLPLGKWDSAEIRKRARRMIASGNTPLATAMTRGYDALRRQGAAQLGYGEYHLVVITDGQASDGEYPDKIVARILSESPVDIHTIGFCIGADHVLNQPAYLSYQSADNVEALRRGLQDVLAEAPAFTVSSFK